VVEAPIAALSGSYLGEEEADDRPRVFSPGFICTGLNEREPTWAPDGKSVYFWAILPGYTVILTSRLEAGGWTRPEVASFSGRHSDFEPCFSSDGQKLFFCSDRPMPGSDEQTDTNIWVMDRKEDGWGEPRSLGAHINSDGVEFFPSVAKNGSLYFNRANADFPGTAVYRAELVNGAYAEPEPLPDVINEGNTGSNVFVADDESFLLMPRQNSGGRIELHVSFRTPDEAWTRPVPLQAELFPMTLDDGARVSPDGRFIFFSANHYPTAGGVWGKPAALDEIEKLTTTSLRTFLGGPQNGGKDIYWVSTTVIESMRPETPS
jgi:hypothetical protein